MHVVKIIISQKKDQNKQFKIFLGKKSKHGVLQAGLKNVSAIKKLLQKAEKQVVPVSVLFKNAVKFFPNPLFSTTEEVWNNLLGLNLKALFFCHKF